MPSREVRHDGPDDDACAFRSMIPESAPFSIEQRAWLNGFFAGLLSLDAKAGATRTRRRDAGCRRQGAGRATTMAPLARRRHADRRAHELAEGKPLPRRLFAAMAQQDCGQCGYLCETYSKAIADGKGSQAQPVRARRQGNEPHAEAAAGGGAGRVRRPPKRRQRLARRARQAPKQARATHRSKRCSFPRRG